MPCVDWGLPPQATKSATTAQITHHFRLTVSSFATDFRGRTSHRRLKEKPRQSGAWIGQNVPSYG